MRSVVSTTRAPSTASIAVDDLRPSASWPGGVDRDVAQRVAVLDLDRGRSAPIVPPASPIARRDPAEHAGPVLDLDADREASTGRRSGRRASAAAAVIRSRGSASARHERRAPSGGRVPDELYLIDGNSLAYRAFFALPESIATSTGFPTNAIFGFASMLVKMLTEHGAEADGRRLGRAARSGRKEVYAEYKAQRTSRPTCCASSGRTSSRSSRRSATATSGRGLRGRRRDRDARRAGARARASRSMIVTGDRDAFQLIDDGVQGDGDRARDHRDEALRPPGGDRPLRHPARS